MTPAEKELWKKAEEAGWNYRKVHGVFPEKIGMHYKRTGFAYQHIVFPVIPTLTVAMIVEDVPPTVSIERHTVPFAPVAGEGVSMNEVYVPAPTPENPNAVLSGTQLTELAKRKEIREHPRIT